MLNRYTTESRFLHPTMVPVSFLLVAWTLPLQAGNLPEQAEGALLNAEWQEALDSFNDVNLMGADVPCRMAAAHGCLATNRNNKALLLLLTVKPEGVKQWAAWTEKLAEAHPSNAVACYLRGDALARSGKMEEADQWFSRAIANDPNFGLARVGRGVVRALAGREDDAYIDLIQATEVQPGLAEAHASLGCAEIAMRNASGALDAFNEALKLNPDFGLAYNGRGCAHYGLGHPDEATEDFRTAEQLFPALTVNTTVNQSFVLAMVLAKVDERMGGGATPGTTITSRTETLPLPSGRVITQLSHQECDRLVDRVGIDRVEHALSTEKRKLLNQLSETSREMKREDATGVRHAWDIYRLEWAKSIVNGATTVGSLGSNIAAKGARTALKKAAPGLGEAAVKAVVSPMMEKIPGPKGSALRTGIAGVSISDLIDPVDLTFTIVQETKGYERDKHLARGTRLCRELGKIGGDLRALEPRLEQVTDRRIAQDLSRKMAGLPPVGRAAEQEMSKALMINGFLPWKQMPELARDLQGKIKDGAPVAIIGPALQAHAMKRMLDNKGIPTRTWPSMDGAKLDALARSTRPSAIVRFKQKQEAIPDPALNRKFFGGLPPGGSGVANSNPTGIPRIDQIRSKHQSPGTLDWKTWTPKGKAGGVTTNMDWVFVDKGDWPVGTFFGLAYELPAAELAGAEDADSRE